MVADPDDYKWSSYLCKTEGVKDAVVDFDKTFLALGKVPQNRQIAYAHYLYEIVPEDDQVDQGSIPEGAGNGWRAISAGRF